MKKILVSLFLFSTAWALPVGNPSEASLHTDGLFWNCCPWRPTLRIWHDFRPRVGFYGDYIFNRHLRAHDFHFKKQLDHAKIFTNAAYFAIGLWNRFDVFATVGASKLWLEGDISTFSPFIDRNRSGRILIETESDLSFSFGARGTWCCCCGTMIGLEGQIFLVDPKVKRITSNALNTANPTFSREFRRAEYTDWQIGLGVSKRFANFIPYIAFKWSGCELKWRHPSFPFEIQPSSTVTFHNFQNRKSLGYALGVTLLDCLRSTITAEARFGDEKALYINAQIRV